MTKYSSLNAAEARATLANWSQKLRVKGIVVFFVVLIYGIATVAIGVAWINNASINYSTFAFALVVIPIFLLWLMFHNFGLPRNVEKVIVVFTTIVFAICIAFAVTQLDMIDWEDALWGLGVFVVLVLGAGFAGEITAGFSNIQNNQDT